jgi:putative transferase (TIGR04331 family)
MTSPFLCTTALSEFWDKGADKIIFLGTWCLRYDHRDEWQDLNYEIVPYPWDDREAMHKAAVYEDEVYEELLGVLAEFLNEVHGEKHNQQYWRIILGPWLLHFIQVLHERYLCLDLALARHPRLQTIGLAESCFKIPRHYWDHLGGSFYQDIYNLQLYTTILQELGVALPRREFQWNWDQPGNSRARPWWKRGAQRLRTLCRRLGLDWAKRAPIFLAGMPQSLVIQLMIRSRFQARWCELPESEKWVVGCSQDSPHPQRQDLGNLALKKTDSLRNLIIKTLPIYFPLMYLEGYRSCRDWVEGRWHDAATRMIMTANGLWGNESFKFLAAELREKGRSLIAVQHGGAYGSARCFVFEECEKKVADEFLSWGWGEGTAGIRPMPNPKLSWLAARHRSGTRRRKPYILFVGNITPRYHYRNWSCPIAGQVIRYLEWQVSFLRALEPEVRKKLILRPYTIDYGWALRQRLRNACPDVNLDEPHHDYYRRLLGASLVVCDMNMTTILESLAANIPTVAFWDQELFELRSEAEPYYQRLRDVGILFHSSREAAQAVNRVWPEVQRWWQQAEVQQVRQNFVHRYARHSPQWRSEWRRYLKECLSNLVPCNIYSFG